MAMRGQINTFVLFTTAVFSPMLLFLFAATLQQPTTAQENRQLNRDQDKPSAHDPREHRIALVIGNGAYTSAPPLKNPPSDARDMAATLKALSFEVTSGVNLNQREMKRLIREFGQSLKAGGSGLFYYAGHGVQSKGRNYLIPIDADIQSEAEVEDSGVDVSLALNFMDDAQNGLNIVILDACRNNPFAHSFRSASDGLAQVDAPTGTLIAYATAPGRVASDGTGQNGLYTSELLKQMRVPALSATEMFMRVRANVMKQTANKQVPWEASSLVGSFYFREPPKHLPDSTTTEGNQARIEPVAVEREYWESIRNSTDPRDYQDYLTNYPHGAYSPIAKTKLRQLEDAKNGDNTNASKGGVGTVPDKTASLIGKDGAGSVPNSSLTGNPNNREKGTPTKRVTMKAFAVELQSCKMSGGDVICDLTVTNNTEHDKEFILCQGDYRVKRRGKDSTKATDNLGTRYEPTESVIGSNRARKGYLAKDVLAPQVAVRLAVTFHDVASLGTSFTLLRIAAYEQGNGNPDLIMYADFRNVVIEK
jgi:hypothetical protein